MVEEQEKSMPRTKPRDTGVIGIPEEMNVAYDMAKERYIGTTGRGADQDTLPTCGNRMAENKAEISIADSEIGVWWSRARQPDTLDIGEENPGWVCAIGRKTTTDHKKLVAMDKGKNGRTFLRISPHLIPRSWQSGLSAHVSPKKRRVETRRHGPGPKGTIERMRPTKRRKARPQSVKKTKSVFHSSLLEPYQDSTIPGHIKAPPPPIELEDGPEYEVATILDSKIVHNKLYYLVDWLGYSPSEHTWEPIENVKCLCSS